MRDYLKKLLHSLKITNQQIGVGEVFHMSWQDVLKADSVLDKMGNKEKKRIKKLLQASQPTEMFGKDMTKLSDLIEELNGAEIVKTSKPLQKKISKFEEKNLDIMASAAELRKDYETLYLQIREEIYPKKKGDKK